MKNVNVEKSVTTMALWELEVQQVEGKSLEKKGREEINEMLSQGWVILSVYTLRFKDGNDTWLERPMAILGLPKHPVRQKTKPREYPPSEIL